MKTITLTDDEYAAFLQWKHAASLWAAARTPAPNKTPISQLPASCRPPLMQAGVLYIEDAQALDDLMSVPGIGRKNFLKIKEWRPA